MAYLPDSLRLTPNEEAELERRRKVARERHEKARRAALKRGRRDFPSLPFECSWAYEEQFRREIRGNGA